MHNQSSNVLEVLGIADREDAITNLLKYCFLRSVSFRTDFLSRVCGIDGRPDGWDARARVQVPGFGTPDLVLWRHGDPGDLVVIENKLNAGEGWDQTQQYADPACLDAIARNVKLGGDFQTHLQFLTLFPDRAKDPNFTSVTYRGLLGDAVPAATEDQLADQLVEALYELLWEFYEHGNIRSDDLLIDRLASSGQGALDGGYLAFLSFLQELELPRGVEVDSPFRQSRRGRKYYGVTISKPDWRSAIIDYFSGPNWTLEPDNHHIHIEPQFNVLSSDFELFVHYETNHYQPVRSLHANVPPEQYAEYKHRRSAFAKRFAALAPPELKIGGRSNQIAKANLSLGDRTVKESSQIVSALIAKAATAIDDAVEQEFGVAVAG
jgi:hypothetical protein